MEDVFAKRSDIVLYSRDAFRHGPSGSETDVNCLTIFSRCSKCLRGGVATGPSRGGSKLVASCDSKRQRSRGTHSKRNGKGETGSRQVRTRGRGRAERQRQVEQEQDAS